MKMWIQLKKAKNMIVGRIYTPINKLRFILNGVTYGKALCVRGNVFIFKHYDSAHIEIGNHVTINSASWANPIGVGEKTYFQLLEGATIRIGNNCGISNSAFTCASEIMLGDNVLLGSGCKLYDTDFHALDYRERLKGNYPGAPVKTKPIIIGEGAFVGAGSFVLKGVRIGKHSIVGAGSVVSKDIPDYEIWAGNPARFIKKVEEQRNDK